MINRQWYSLEWESRTHLKTTLYNFYTELDSTMPHFVRNKLAKLLVDIARYDWPHFYPEFFTNILQVGDLNLLIGRNVFFFLFVVT